MGIASLNWSKMLGKELEEELVLKGYKKPLKENAPSGSAPTQEKKNE